MAATWRIAVAGKRATVTVRPFRALAAPERRGVEEKGAALAAFLAPGAVADVGFAASDER